MSHQADILSAYLQVNMLMSNKGTVLRCDVNGKIVMKVFLSGMPDVKLGLNDKLEVCFQHISNWARSTYIVLHLTLQATI